ncbi:YHS domain-containing protein [Lysobacter terrae]
MLGGATVELSRPHIASTRPWCAPVDLVCGLPVEPVPIPYHLDYADQDYYFCSLRCLQKFKAEPARYIGDPTS